MDGPGFFDTPWFFILAGVATVIALVVRPVLRRRQDDLLKKRWYRTTLYVVGGVLFAGFLTALVVHLATGGNLD